MDLLKIGTRVYNCYNQTSHFGTIVEISTPSKSSYIEYLIQPDKEKEEAKPYWVFAMGFSPVYKGNGSTPFVTEEAYRVWQRVWQNEQRQKTMELLTRMKKAR